MYKLLQCYRMHDMRLHAKSYITFMYRYLLLSNFLFTENEEAANVSRVKLYTYFHWLYLLIQIITIPRASNLGTYIYENFSYTYNATHSQIFNTSCFSRDIAVSVVHRVVRSRPTPFGQM